MTIDGRAPSAPRTPGGPARRAAGDRSGHIGTGYPSARMTASADLTALAERTWERTLELNPTLATIYGDERYDDRLDDPGPAGRAARRALADETLGAASAIPEASLDEEERITRQLLRLAAATEIADDETRMDLVGAVQQQGHQSLLPELVQFQKADTPERLERLLARLAAYPAVADAVIGLLDEGTGGRPHGCSRRRRADRWSARTAPGRAGCGFADRDPPGGRAGGRSGPDPRGSGAACPAGRRALPGGAARLPAVHPRGARPVFHPGRGGALRDSHQGLHQPGRQRGGAPSHRARGARDDRGRPPRHRPGGRLTATTRRRTGRR